MSHKTEVSSSKITRAQFFLTTDGGELFSFLHYHYSPRYGGSMARLLVESATELVRILHTSSDKVPEGQDFLQESITTPMPWVDDFFTESKEEAEAWIVLDLPREFFQNVRIIKRSFDYDSIFSALHLILLFSYHRHTYKRKVQETVH